MGTGSSNGCGDWDKNSKSDENEDGDGKSKILPKFDLLPSLGLTQWL